ncbi:unnamed protein product, partial [Rotaria sp. Silwood2]
LIGAAHTKLDEHSTDCSTALPIFLECRPKYLCFVPMTDEQVRIGDANITSIERNFLAKYQGSISIEETERSSYLRDMELVR